MRPECATSGSRPAAGRRGGSPPSPRMTGSSSTTSPSAATAPASPSSAAATTNFPTRRICPIPAPPPLTPPQQVFVVAGRGRRAAHWSAQGHSPDFLAGRRRGWPSPAGARSGCGRAAARRGASPRSPARSGGSPGRRTAAPAVHRRSRRAQLSSPCSTSTAQRLRYLDPGLRLLGRADLLAGRPAGRLHPLPVAARRGAAPDSGPYWSIRIVDLATGAARTLWSAPAGPGGRYSGHAQPQPLLEPRTACILFPWERTGWLHVYALDAAEGRRRRAT